MARLTAVATAVHDWSGHGANARLGREGWERAPDFTRDVVSQFVRTVGTAVEGIGGLVDVEVVTATCYGTAHVAELMHDQLHTGGPRWLAPESIVSYSPHAVTSAAALAHGIGGAGCTLVGTDAGTSALAHALRRVAVGTEKVVVAGYEALTAHAVEALAELGVTADAGTREAVALVVTGDGPGRPLTLRRGCRGVAAVREHFGDVPSYVVGDVPGVADHFSDVVAVPGASPVTASLLALARAWGDDGARLVMAPGTGGVDAVLLS